MVDGLDHYRNEYERKNILRREDMTSKDAQLVASHWAKESDAWISELKRWKEFKQAQQIHHQCARDELDLELENTDPALVQALSKLNDWQEFQFIHQKEVHEAERCHETCQQGIARNHDAMVVASSADSMLNLEEPIVGWTSYMVEAQERLETSQKELIWVKSQWPEVIAEACSLISVPTMLQEQLEAKFETQTKAIHRALCMKGARPSHAVYAPDSNTDLPQRIQHWISQSSAFTAELWDWRIFMAWRRHIRDTGNMSQEGRKVLSEGDSSSELFEDFVKYQQYGLDKAASWVNCWRHEAREYRKAKRRTPPSYGGWSFREIIDHDDHDDHDKENEVVEAKRADVYAMHAEEKVCVAQKRLEQSKRELQGILTESTPLFKSKIPAAHPTTQLPPTPPRSHSSKSSPDSQRPSEQKGPAGKGLRRSKKERIRKGEAKMANANTEQHALPPFTLGSSALEEHQDIEMSDDAEDPTLIEVKKETIDSEDTVMSDVEDRPDQTPPSSPHPHPKPISDTDSKNLLSPRSPCPTLRKTRSATKLDQVPSGRISKKPNKKKPRKKAKDLTEAQTEALLNAASPSAPPTGPTPLERTEPEPYPTPATDINNRKSPSPTSSSTGPTSHERNEPEPRPTPTTGTNNRKPPSPTPTSPVSRRTRSATKLEQIPPGKILKKPSKEKPLKKGKAYTEQQKTELLNAASSSGPSTSPILLRRSERLKGKAAAALQPVPYY